MESTQRNYYDLEKVMSDAVRYTKELGIGGLKTGKFMENYRGILVNSPFYFMLEDFDSFEAYEDDLVLAGCVKTGASRFAATVSMIKADADPEHLYQPPDLQVKVPWLDFSTHANRNGPRGLEYLKNYDRPRAYWTRFHYEGLPKSVKKKNVKIIYHLRHPKDALVTLYHHLRAREHLTKFKGSISEIVDLCCKDLISFGPWFDHYASYWAQRDRPNILIVSFEEYTQDPQAMIQKLSQFMGKKLSDEQIRAVEYHCHFDRMAANTHTRHDPNNRVGEMDFQIAVQMRRGAVGGWKDFLSKEDNDKMNTWMLKHLNRHELQGLAERFPETFKTEDLP